MTEANLAPKVPSPVAAAAGARAAIAASATPKPGFLKGRGVVALIPVFGDGLAMMRLLFDKRPSIWAKLLVVAVIGYVVWPIDLIPDAVPFFGWLDDLGVLLAARVALSRHLEPYRYPLFKKPAAPAPSAPIEVTEGGTVAGERA
ncbi:MAG TPA: YkvA family protein [Byssovorax sp.]